MLPFQKEYSWVNDDNNEADVISRYVIPFLDRIIESIQTQYSSYQSSRDNMLSSPVKSLIFWQISHSLDQPACMERTISYIGCCIFVRLVELIPNCLKVIRWEAGNLLSVLSDRDYVSHQALEKL